MGIQIGFELLVKFGMDIKIDDEVLTEKPIEGLIGERAKESWRGYLLKLTSIKPEKLNLEKIAISENIRLFRGTSICDVLYAILEKNGRMISPLSYSYYEPIPEKTMGTILTDNLAEAVSVANSQLIEDDVLQKKIAWMSSVIGMSKEELIRVGGLWQPIVLEITNNIPRLEVENHYAEIWSTKPINLLEGSISEQSMVLLRDHFGIDILSRQRKRTESLSDFVISNIIRECKLKQEILWEQAIPDESIWPIEEIDK